MLSRQYYSQDLRSGKENSSKDGKHVFIHESPAIAIQHKKDDNKKRPLVKGASLVIKSALDSVILTPLKEL